MTRVAHPQFSFADLEFLTQGIDLDPILKRISEFLDDHPKIVKIVRKDLEWGVKKPDTGRSGMTAPQVMRSLILMRVKNWDYRELRERGLPTATHCVSSRVSTVSAPLSTTLSIGLLTNCDPRHFKPSMI